MDLALSVVVPCFNEEENLPLLVERLETTLTEHGIEGEIILVDDASRDGTRESIRREAARRANVVGCYHDVNQGIVGGWRTGLSVARGEYVVTIDADLQYQPEDVARLYAEARASGADLVQGWRRFSKENHFVRYALSVGLSGMLNVLFLMRLKDIKSGFILYRKEAFADILEYRGQYRMFQHFVTIAAHAKGYRIRQIPVTFERRHAGESFITQPARFAARVLREIPTAFLEYRVRGGK
jgi:phenylacetate-CoA ligase